MLRSLVVMLAALCISIHGTPRGRADDSAESVESLADRLRSATVVVELEYTASSGPESLLLASRQQCAACHSSLNGMSLSGLPVTVYQPDAAPDAAPTLPLTPPEPSEASNNRSPDAGVDGAEARSSETVHRQVNGVLLSDGRTIVAADPISEPIVSVSARRVRGGSVAAATLARWSAGGLLFLRADEPLAGGLALAESPARLGRAALAGIGSTSGPFRIARGVVTAEDLISGGAEPRIEFDIHSSLDLSGVPVVDEQGSLMAVLTRPSGEAASIGVTALTLAALQQQLPTESTPTPVAIALPTAWIGVELGEVDGAIVATGFPESSPAAAAGMLVGDRIEAVDGRAVESLNQLIALIRRAPVGSESRIQVRRSDSTQELAVRLQALPGSHSPAASQPSSDNQCPALYHGSYFPFPYDSGSNPSLWRGDPNERLPTSLLYRPWFRYQWQESATDQPLTALRSSGLTVIPAGPSDEKLSELATKLEKLATSLRALSDEVRAIRQQDQ